MKWDQQCLSLFAVKTATRCVNSWKFRDPHDQYNFDMFDIPCIQYGRGKYKFSIDVSFTTIPCEVIRYKCRDIGNTSKLLSPTVVKWN